jgi:hypothetical protein
MKTFTMWYSTHSLINQEIVKGHTKGFRAVKIEKRTHMESNPSSCEGGEADCC